MKPQRFGKQGKKRMKNTDFNNYNAQQYEWGTEEQREIPKEEKELYTLNHKEISYKAYKLLEEINQSLSVIKDVILRGEN